MDVVGVTAKAAAEPALPRLLSPTPGVLLDVVGPRVAAVVGLVDSDTDDGAGVGAATKDAALEACSRRRWKKRTKYVGECLRSDGGARTE